MTRDVCKKVQNKHVYLLKLFLNIVFSLSIVFPEINILRRRGFPIFMFYDNEICKSMRWVKKSTIVPLSGRKPRDLPR